ncbi:MAG: LLM class F420-dependent oxidoreductase [Gammaproteobacteria bacterium]|nr:LLM class F420-dependent oxidoreductase [Gammaproteobacteria bacterium]
MKLGLVTGYSGSEVDLPMDEILEAERLGFDSVWTAEAYGSDALTPAAWILARTSRIKAGTAIMQIPARTPTSTAMSAMTLQGLSGGRFILGLGPSGPQVVEGWYGTTYAKPLTRMREYIDIVRQVLAREAPVQYDGYHYQLPYRGDDSTGLGRALKSILHSDPNTKIYTAAITEGGIRLAAELADGFFPVWMNPDRYDLFAPAIDAGFAAAGNGKSRAGFDVAPFVRVSMGDELDQCRNVVKRELALYIGGMGAKDKNFYNDYAGKLGYEDDAITIQDLFLSGKKLEAAAAVPDTLVDDVSLVGPPDRIRDNVERWKEAGKRGDVGSFLASGASVEALRLLAEELL